ncbi:hypothetical protein ACS91J_12490 [Pectobacterium carotovorum]
MINRIEGGSRWGSTASSAAQHNTEASRPGGQQDVSPAMRSGSRSIDFGEASPNVADRSLIAEPKPPVDLQAIDSSAHSNARALEKWSPLLSDLPENEREKAAKELNRPLAAAKMLQDGGARIPRYRRNRKGAESAMRKANSNTGGKILPKRLIPRWNSSIFPNRANAPA